MEVKIIKLINGEELIGEISEELNNEGLLVLKKPLGLGMDIDHEAKVQKLVFVPYMPYAVTEEVLIPLSSLLIGPVDPLESIANDYAQAVGSIVAPRRSIIRPTR